MSKAVFNNNNLKIEYFNIYTYVLFKSVSFMSVIYLSTIINI